MIKKGSHLEGVEPINEKEIDNALFLSIIEEKLGIQSEAYKYLSSKINGRNLYDKSGYSGSSTLIVNKDSNNIDEFVIKIQPKNKLYDEFIAYNYFYKKGLTSKPLKYFDCGKYEVTVVEKINLPVAGYYFNSYQEISVFFGKKLREFHDLNLIDDKLQEEEINSFSNKFINSYNKAIKKEEGLSYLSIYMNDYDYDQMRVYVEKNKHIMSKNKVLVHGDFNPNNVFIDKDLTIKLIDFCDTGIVNKHYDIFWTLFMIIIFSGILKEKNKINECEKIFLESYGRSQINEEELDYFKKFACLYWQQHDEITRIDIL